MLFEQHCHSLQRARFVGLQSDIHNVGNGFSQQGDRCRVLGACPFLGIARIAKAYCSYSHFASPHVESIRWSVFGVQIILFIALAISLAGFLFS